MDTQEREGAVLGGMMLSKSALADVSELINDRDFAEWRNRITFTAIMSLANDGAPVDPIAVAERMSKRKTRETDDDHRSDLTMIGGAITLHDMISDVPNAASAPYYAKIMRRDAVKRRLVEAGTKIASLAASEETDAAALIEVARARVDEAVADDLTEATIIGDDIDSVIDALSTAPEYLPTPWRAANDMINGFKPGALYVVGARPGAGKSIIGLQAAMHVSKWGNVALSSLEMPREELTHRMLALKGSVHMTQLTRHSLSKHDWESVARHAQSLRDMPLFVDDRSGTSIAQIRAHARSVARKGRMSAIVVDYLQLIKATDSKRARWEQVTEISRALKIMARDFNVPVIALAQLNRESESNKRPPTLADLRESGSIEQDADVVLLLTREFDELAGTPTDNLDVIVAKNRHGSTGKFTLMWEGHYARVSDAPWAE